MMKIKHFFGIDLGARKVVCSYIKFSAATSQESIGQEDSYVEMQFCGVSPFGEGKQRKLKKGVLESLCIHGGLKKFLGIKKTFSYGNESYDVEELGMSVLEDLRKLVQNKFLEGRVLADLSEKEECVTLVGYPFGWSEIQKNAYLKTVEKAGFPNVQGVEEPLVSLYCFEKSCYAAKGISRECVLFFDLGTNSLNVSIGVLSKGQDPKNLAMTGDPSFGGMVFDAQIEILLREGLKQKDDLDTSCLKDLHPIAVMLKERLSSAVGRGETQITAKIYPLKDKIDSVFEFSLSKYAFEERIQELFPKFEEPLWEALSKAFLQPEDIDTIFFVGAGAQLWCVREKIETLFPNARIFWSSNPQETVARGLALYGIRKRLSQKKLLNDVPRKEFFPSLGEEAFDGSSKKRTDVPKRGKKLFSLVVASFCFFALVGWLSLGILKEPRELSSKDAEMEVSSVSSEDKILPEFIPAKVYEGESSMDVMTDSKERFKLSKDFATHQEVFEGERKTESLDISQEMNERRKYLSGQEDMPIFYMNAPELERSDFFEGIKFFLEISDGFFPLKKFSGEDYDDYANTEKEGFPQRVLVALNPNAANRDDIGNTIFLYPIERESKNFLYTLSMGEILGLLQGEFGEELLFFALGRKKEITASPVADGALFFGDKKVMSYREKHSENDILSKKIIEQMANFFEDDSSAKIPPALILFDAIPQDEKLNEMVNIEFDLIFVPPMEWHRAFWLLVFLKENVSKPLNEIDKILEDTLSIVVKERVLLYKRNQSGRIFEKIKNFPENVQ